MRALSMFSLGTQAGAPLWAVLLLATACETVPETIDGRVVDVWGNPLEGATVMIVGGTERQLTGADGRYSLPRIEGSVEIKTGRKGFVQHQEKIEVKPGEPAIGPLFQLYPKPEKPGFYAVGTSNYLQIAPKPVRLTGTTLKQFRGLAEPGDVALDTDSPQILYHIDIRYDEIVRLGLNLRRLKLVGEEEIPGPLGATPVPVNLYIDDGGVPIDIVALGSRSDYLLIPKQPMERGHVYAFQTQGLLTTDAEHFSTIPEELRIVFPFTLR